MTIINNVQSATTRISTRRSTFAHSALKNSISFLCVCVCMWKEGGEVWEEREVQMDDYSHMVDFLYLRHAKIRDIHHHHRIRLSETKLMCLSPLTMMLVEFHVYLGAAVPLHKHSSHRRY
jgi:hypothetical protein